VIARARDFGSIDDLAHAHQQMGWINLVSGDHAVALAHFAAHRQAWDELDYPAGRAQALADSGLALTLCGDLTAAQPLIDAADPLYRAAGDVLGMARVHADRGLLALIAGDLPSAISQLRESIALHQSVPYSRALPNVQFYYATALAFTGHRANLREAVRLYRAVLPARVDLGDAFGLSLTILGLAAVAHRAALVELSARLCGASLLVLERTGMGLPPTIQGIYDREIGNVRAQLSDEAFTAAFDAGQRMTIPEVFAAAATIETAVTAHTS
jgi:tetratricopeptide (TPR) repeat protein